MDSGAMVKGQRTEDEMMDEQEIHDEICAALQTRDLGNDDACKDALHALITAAKREGFNAWIHENADKLDEETQFLFFIEAFNMGKREGAREVIEEIEGIVDPHDANDINYNAFRKIALKHLGGDGG